MSITVKPISCVVCDDAIPTVEGTYVLVGVNGGMFDFEDSRPHIHLSFFTEMEVTSSEGFSFELKLFATKKSDAKINCEMQERMSAPEDGKDSFAVFVSGVLDVYEVGLHEFDFKYRINSKPWKSLRKIMVRYSSSNETAPPS